jgi:hypothetical protein
MRCDNLTRRTPCTPSIEKAFFYGSRSAVNKLWKMFCRKNCDVEPDRAAVPYFVHRDDMAKVPKLSHSRTLALSHSRTLTYLINPLII